MNVMEWSESSVGYGRKLLDSAVEGAREGEGEFLKEEPLEQYLTDTALNALGPAAIGACVGIAGGWLSSGRRSTRALTYGLAGAVIGFGAGLIWDSWPLTTRVVSKAWQRIARTRDEHWFEKNPIDYA